jgi:hypothetical protein
LDKKCNFSRLLEETNEKYYWLGFLLADGSFSKRKEIKIGLSIKDENHLIKLKKFLRIENIHYYKNSVYICGKDTKIFETITKKYNISSIKTYIPPDLSSIKNDKMFSLLIGFIDGDGCISKQYKRNDFLLRIKNHKNWQLLIDNIIDEVYHFLEIPNPPISKIDNSGYSNMTISDTYVLKKIKSKAIQYKLPIINRKWDNIDLKYISRVEKVKMNIIEINKYLHLNKTQREISKILDITESNLSKIIKRYNLKNK